MADKEAGETHMPAATLGGWMVYKFKNGRRAGISRCRKLIWEGLTDDSFSQAFADATCSECFDGYRAPKPSAVILRRAQPEGVSLWAA